MRSISLTFILEVGILALGFLLTQNARNLLFFYLIEGRGCRLLAPQHVTLFYFMKAWRKKLRSSQPNIPSSICSYFIFIFDTILALYDLVSER